MADPQRSLTYRPDIDGLRAVSILSVVLFHFGVPNLDGGFVGVDVFFVISGFLITSIVFQEIRTGSFSLVRFYERRARRLLPTLSCVLVATFAAAVFILTPQDLVEFCKSLFYALVFAANLYFADQGGYFSPSLELAPLLHMWSLAVEEQFYIVWPLLLLLLARFAPRATVGVAVLLLVVSFGANLHLVGQKPLAAFFLPHTRVWELLAGCLLALGAVPPLRGAAAHGAGVAGLGLILFAVLSFNAETPFPGIAALAPVLGACLVIWSGQAGPSLASRVLAVRPMVFIGLVSYAWYLWHWPMIALFRYQLERMPSAGETAALIAVSFALAVLSWRFLEVPVRHGAWWRPRARVAGAALTASAALMGLVAAGYFSEGFVARYPVAMRELERAHLALRPHDRNCPRPVVTQVAEGDVCRVWDGGPSPGLLLWGDSHAGSIIPAFRDVGEANGVSVSATWTSACPPLIGAGRKRRRGGTDFCTTHNAAVEELLRRRAFSDVVLVARWNYYADGIGDGVPAPEQHYLRDAQSRGVSLAENKAVIARGLKRTIAAIEASGARAWVVLEVPFVGFNPPNRIARAIMRGDAPDTLAGLDAATLAKKGAFMKALTATLPAGTLDPAPSFCDGGTCLAVAKGKPLYFDDNHLSFYGAERLVPMLSAHFPKRSATR